MNAEGTVVSSPYWSVPSSPSPSLVEGLRAIVGNDYVVTDPEVVASYAVDWTGRYRGSTPCVVRPADTRDVAALVAWCASHEIAITLQGGNTGLVGGAVPDGGVVLSTRRLATVADADVDSGQVTVGAGATLGALQQSLLGSGWEFGVDLAARETATIGGMVATNAGGIRVVRYGTMRAQLLGIEAILGDGSVIRHLGGLVKDNTGYDLGALLCGSEGTLGVVTAARVRLVPRLASRVVAIAAVGSVAEAVEVTGRLRREVSSLDAVEAVIAPGMATVANRLRLPPLFEAAPAVVLAEAASASDPSDELASVLAELEHVVATDPTGRGRLWRYREAQSDAIAQIGIPHKLDVTLPASALASFVGEVTTLVGTFGAQAFIFGHLGDGNLHVNVVGPKPDDELVDDAVLELVATFGGSISAEHGIGRAKRRWLHLCREPAEIAAFRAVKHALDPSGILNPGVLLPDP